MQPRTPESLLPRLCGALAVCACLSLAACATRHADEARQGIDLPQFPTPPADGAIFHTGYSPGLFDNPTARNVGDTVTVILQESTAAQKSSQTDTAKTTKDSLAAPTVLGNQVTIHGTPILSGSLNNANSFSGSGDSKQSDSLVGDITVTVVKRLQNGNLLVRGQKYVDINQGSEYVRLEGIIRPIDIAADNTIPSTEVADARIAYGQKGALNDANRPGLLSRFFNSPWLPF
ncbi:MAG TPA: flagellar basal body L-ring protein FlgH [Steroidobacteraceae bacterium]|nr:flagellar basal body L-ring protein FlgH [Steroidobacteraceae bacterium]